MEPTFFETGQQFRRWLDRHHREAQELWVGYHKKGTGRKSITWPESVDEALCFGWIDGLRKSLDEESYMIRFTPRKPKSVWSDKNIRRMEELLEEGLVEPAGVAAFERREEDRSRRYSFEQDQVEFPGVLEKQFRREKTAWSFFQAQPPYYRKIMTWWVISARRDTTRSRRLAVLIEESAAGRRIDPMRPRDGK